MAFLDDKYLLDTETAFALYTEMAQLPVSDTHSRADVCEILKNAKYADPWQLLAEGNPGLMSLLRKRGVVEKYVTGDADTKEKWMELARRCPELIGNPVYEWLHMDLRTLGITDVQLSASTGEDVWEQAKAVLQVNSNRPQNLLNRMNVEMLCVAGDPLDPLDELEAVNAAMTRMILRPVWTPTAVFDAGGAGWKEYVNRLEQRFHCKIGSVKELLDTLNLSYEYFGGHGCRTSDYRLSEPLDGSGSAETAEKVFQQGMSGDRICSGALKGYQSYLLMSLAELDAKSGRVCQLHIGGIRGMEAEADLNRFLDRFEGRLKVLLHSQDEAHTDALTRAVRSHGMNVRPGLSWNMADTPEAMGRRLEELASHDLLYNFAGLETDTRKLLAYSSRIEMFRRVLANTVAGMVNRGRMPLAQALPLVKRICHTGAKEFFEF